MIKRSLTALVLLLLAISVARLLVSMHQQQERIEILEDQVAQLLADTSRLVIAPDTPTRYHSADNHYSSDNHRPYHHSSNPRYAQRSAGTVQASQPADSSSAAASAASSASAPRTQNCNSAVTRTGKFTEVHTFDLNTIDSITLVRIPGIAERTASVILKYRQRYGGFYDTHQLAEFLTWDAAQAYMDEWCNQWFSADASRLRRIPINTATVAQLQRHPYITYQQAIELVRFRSRHHPIISAEQLQQLTTFDQQQLNQLLPYLSFE